MLDKVVVLKEKALFCLLRVKKGEEGTFFSMAFLMFTILLCQNILRNIKDSWIVTLIGAQSIVFIKLWVEAPMGALFIFLYTKLCNKVNLCWVFRYVILFFISYFLIFLLVLMPNMHILHMSSDTVKYLTCAFPHAKWFFLLASQWTVVSFYVMGEMVPIVVLPILFWQIPNSTSSVEQSKRFYPSLSFFGQSNLLALFFLINYFPQKFFANLTFSHISNASNNSNLIIKIRVLLIIAILLFVLCLVLHKFINRKIERTTQDREYNIPLKLNIKETIKLVLSSPYVLRIVLLVLCYSLSINLMEMLWFDKISAYYSNNTTRVMQYHAKVSLFTGLFTLIFSLIGTHIIAMLGWLFAAALTPITILFTGVLFFAGVIYQEHFSNGMTSWLKFIVVLCALQTILSKSVKYSLFDSTKEMAYVPLPKELKIKGKAALEICSIHIAKILGSSIQSAIFIFLPHTTCSDAKFILFVLFLVCMFTWITNVKQIGTQYNLQEEEQKGELKQKTSVA